MKLCIYTKIENIRNSIHRLYIDSIIPEVEKMKKMDWICIPSDECINLSDLIHRLEIQYLIIYTFDGYDFIMKYLECMQNLPIYIILILDDLHQKDNKDNVLKTIICVSEHSTAKFIFFSTYWYCFNKFYPNITSIHPYPHFIHDKWISIGFNSNPMNQIILSGCISSLYPARKKLLGLNHNKIVRLKHTHQIYGLNYYQRLNQYICGFTCCANANTPYIVGKFFEIPAMGCLLLAYDEYVKEPLKELGFIDGVNYLSCSFENLEEKVNWITNSENRPTVDSIRKNGYDLTWNLHKISDRLKFLNDTLNLNPL